MASEYSVDLKSIGLTHEAVPHLSLIDRYAQWWMALALVAIDVACLAAANLAALLVRNLWDGGYDISRCLEYLPVVFFFVIIYSLRGLYSPLAHGEVSELYHLSVTTSLGFLIVGAMTYFLKSPVDYSRLAFGFTWLLALGLVPLGRFAIRQVFTRLGLWGIPVLVIGEREAAGKVADFFKLFPRTGLRPVGIFAPAGAAPCWSDPHENAHRQLRQFCDERCVRTGLVVCATLNELEAVREEYRDIFERIILVSGEDNGLQLSGVSVHELGGMLGLVVRQNLLDPWSQRFKRFTDVAGAGLGLVVLSSLLAVIALLIKLDDPGRIFYHQKRVGRNGKEFDMLKFRTMHMNAEQVLKTHLERNPAMQQEWDTYQKLNHDPRITRIGRLLRRYSLDELPQLWNVLVGQMSLVGPRPILLNQKALYGPRFEHYVRVTPGMTGIWQVSGRNQLSFEKRAELDVQYVMSWSVWLDIYLLVRTVRTVLLHEGAS